MEKNRTLERTELERDLEIEIEKEMKRDLDVERHRGKLGARD